MSARCAVGVLALAVVGLSAAPARAQSPCARLAAPITDHSCFHARLGPFQNVTAGDSSAAAVDNVDSVHTYYSAALPAPGKAAKLSYTPARSGRWALYLQHDVPYEVRRAGRPVAAIHQDDVPGCPFFARVAAFELSAGVAVELVLGPTTASEVGLVLERLEDFETLHARDRDGDGYGDPTDVVTSPCTPAPGYVVNDEDCDDRDPAKHPGAPEVCGGADRNCNGVAGDDGAPCVAGRGACATSGILRCTAAGATPTCSAVASPPGFETCDGVDQDCDGAADLAEPELCTDPQHPRCVSDGRGGNTCGCERDADCGPVDSGLLCWLRGTEQRCIEGCVDGFGRNGCASGHRCSSADPAAPGVCEPIEPGEGCGCNGAEPIAPSALALLGLVALLRRRPHRR